MQLNYIEKGVLTIFKYNKMKNLRPKDFVFEGEIVFDRMQVSTLKKLEEMCEVDHVQLIILNSFIKSPCKKCVNVNRNCPHLRGYAVDIYFDNAASKREIVGAALKAGFKRICFAKHIIHLDDDPSLPPNII